ncbi:MAG: hypothetical protein M1835_005470 [Candelina submexicana]|nr:MAG: hypothetical protein M1835_005470 [Candelina submexicana]
MSATKWSLVLHGGCANTKPDLKHRSDVTNELRKFINAACISVREGKNAKDVVVEIITALEDCQLFNAGKGAALTGDGAHELEAGIVDGRSGLYGAVACVSETKNPIVAANAMLEEGPPFLLVGQPADDMSRKRGIETVANRHFTVPLRRKHWEQKKRGANLETGDDLGTVGAIVLDRHGNLACGGSTGGLNGKPRGRIGDTAILGAGFSGAGDQILRHLVATKLARYHSSGRELGQAANRALMEFSQSDKTCAILAMDSAGTISSASTAQVFYTASSSSDSPIQVNLQPPTHPLFPHHTFHNGSQTFAGLSRRPTTKGHAHVVLQTTKHDLFSLDLDKYMQTMLEAYQVAGVLRSYYDVARCALITNGSDILSVIPLHGLEKNWEQFTCSQKEFHESFPGYISSKDGPQMDASRLEDICNKIQKISGISAAYNYRFDGEQSDQNLFARIVRGQLPQSRVWEDEEHVAFLTPFANTPGFTVLVPRTHLASDIFGLSFTEYSSLVRSAYSVAQILKLALGLSRCGMIFEGFEIDYAHIKLVPIHEKEGILETPEHPSPMTQSTFEENYAGYVTSQDGPLTKDAESLTIDAMNIRNIYQVSRIEPPKSWQKPSDHCSRVLREPWYSKVLAVQDAVFHATTQYFKNGLGYKYGLLPATTDAISSPMGLGSDSQPVPVTLFGQQTHLADSMQFALEYLLESKKACLEYITLAALFAVRILTRCISINSTTWNVSLLATSTNSVRALAGGITHLQAFVDRCRRDDGQLPRITLDQALALPGMDESTWKFAVPSQPDKGRCITRAGELQLIKHFGGAVWLTEMDHISVPFYQAFTDNTRAKARCADLLLGNEEVLGLGERHLSLLDVSEALKQHAVPAGPYKWYVEMRQTSEIQTAGWGMGVERFLAWVFQHDDIRDLAIIPRIKGLRFAP